MRRCLRTFGLRKNEKQLIMTQKWIHLQLTNHLRSHEKQMENSQSPHSTIGWGKVEIQYLSFFLEVYEKYI